ncbi:hypothetical protein HPB50_010219 [Hyalomma asiaticum]|uniref:Uncharacterized protein n=1 Tax=Hyalomma asiaticum TaxID=266040 RepID=A0ACB7RSY8_HYAAI|nr:hypothetical protein HPB50_010219 [Hyalomma asiaticum]
MRWLIRTARFFGCLFISNFSSQTLDKSVASWKSPYIVYAAMWLWILLAHRGRITLSVPPTTLEPYQDFIENVGFVIRVLALLKALVNCACFCFGSAGFLEFMKSATSFERSSSPVSTEGRTTDWSRVLFNLALRTIIWVSLALVFFTTRMISISHANSTLKYLPAGREAVAFCSDVAFFTYDFLMYPAVIVCSEVLVLYLKRELARLEACRNSETMSSVTGQCDPVTVVDTVRVNVCKIKAMKTRLNDLCSPAIVTSSACLLISMCVNLQRLFLLKTNEALFWLSVGYMSYNACCLADMAFVSEDLGKEVGTNSI